MIFEMPQKVLFKHCDPAGIVFYPRYFEMMNDCVEAFFDHVGVPFADLHRTHAVPTVEIETAFHAPSRHGELLHLALSVTRIGTSSASVRILATCQGAARMRFAATLVHVDGAGRPEPWPGAIRTALTPYLEGDAA